MLQRRGLWRVVMLVLVSGLVLGWMHKVEGKPAATEQYMEPRFPSYLKPPKTIEDVMPYARRLVRNRAQRGGLGLGAAAKGDHILIVMQPGYDPMMIDAIGRALQERGVKVEFVPGYEFAGVSKEDAEALRKWSESATSEKGFLEVDRFWISSQFANPEGAKQWLKEQRPDLYDQLYPKGQDLTPHLQQVRGKMKMDNIGKGIQDYLKKHPQTKGLYWGTGGGAGVLRALHPMENKFLGFFTYDNRWEVMSEIPSFPADVWQLAEEQEMEPIAYVDKATLNDPEGTDLNWDVTEEMAQRWARGVYQRGHLYMFPTQATGRFAFSFVDYPALQKSWIPREPMSLANGVVAGTNGHYGFNERMEQHYKNGYLVEVKGVGPYSDLLRTFMKYPKSNELTYPFHTHPGFWYLYEVALGTHPKWYRNPQLMMQDELIPERNRSGVFHFGVGLRLWHDPTDATYSKSWMDFTAKYNLPRDHDFHLHNYFATFKFHLRNANRWIALVDRGRLTSLDNPEVKALASRYGSPARILAEDWVPEIPGINAPGRYEDYARDPWKVAKAVIDKAVAGNYDHYYPPVGSAKRAGGK